VQAISQQAQQMQQQAQQLLQKADAEIATLKAQVVHQQELLKDKSQDLAIKAHSVAIDDYNAESKRLDVVGGIDPTALQLVVRQLVQDMLAPAHPMPQQHAANEELQVPWRLRCLGTATAPRRQQLWGRRGRAERRRSPTGTPPTTHWRRRPPGPMRRSRWREVSVAAWIG
jgi:hypothetical protein